MGLKKEGQTRSVTGADLQSGDRLVPDRYAHAGLFERAKEGVKVVLVEEIPSDPNALTVYVEEDNGLTSSILIERDAEYQVVE